jgi:hypothetical protein
MNGSVRFVICCAIAICSVQAVSAQATLRPTPPPQIAADEEPWYLAGEPVMYAGNIYYPAGPQVHFNGDEMVPSGFYRGVPLYAQTTIEPYSKVFVPLAGRLMQPYERRREGELAGTTGSSAPSFPVASPSGLSREYLQLPPMAEAAGPPMLGSGIPSPARPPVAVEAARSRPVGTSGRVEAAPPRAAAPIRRRPESANGIFVEFDNARWYSSGPPALLDSGLMRIGSTGGFPVYAARKREPTTIYIPVASGLDLVAPYSKRRDK